jgi:arylsulfatase A-like enzyme
MPVPQSAWGNDWGAAAADNEQMGDWKTAGWISEKLKSGKLPEPFFLAWGCKLPHVPLYAPQKYFDMYPIDKISMPLIRQDDLDDVPEAAKQIGSRGWPWKPHEYIKKYGKAKNCVQAYLACISFVDDCVGRILEAFNACGYKDNTVVVFVSDHGMHKGEKDNWSKYTLWEEATNVPLIFAGKGIESGRVCREPVSLLDFYPTFIEMCGLTKVEQLDGQSLMPLLAYVGKDFGRVSVTTYGQNFNSVRSRDWRYIRYGDGSEELYNHREDPYEWNNLAAKPQCRKIKEDLAAHIAVSQRKPANPIDKALRQ